MSAGVEEGVAAMRLGDDYRRVLAMSGAVALTAGMLAVAAVGGSVLAGAGPASAAPASASTAGPVAAGETGEILTAVASGIKVLGHTWSLEIQASKTTVSVEFWTVHGATTENHLWESSASFAATAAKDLTVTSTAHATLKTGSTLSPVVAASLAFTPTKRMKQACTSGSWTNYLGHVTGTLTLVTGLRRVRVSHRFSATSGHGELSIEKSCVQPPVKPLCGGPGWVVSWAPDRGLVSDEKTLSPKPVWYESFDRVGGKTASKWLSREDGMEVKGGRAPRVNTAAHTVTGSEYGAITGTAVIHYARATTLSPYTCYLGRKRYAETFIEYLGNVRVTKAFRTHTVLTGTWTLTPAKTAIYTGIRLRAK
jgi:hypothetical protein